MSYSQQPYEAIGADWCAKRNKKKKVLRDGRGQTAGSTKGYNCTASTPDRYMAGRSRSYKHPDYPNWVIRKCRQFSPIP